MHLHTRALLSLFGPLVLLGGAAGPPEGADLAAARARMVEKIVRMGVRDERVLATLRKVPRHELVPVSVRNHAYDDTPLPIGEDQTISQPFIVAFMTEALRLKPTDKVLEIGTGSGYQTAVLAELAAEVFSIEIVEPLGRRAAKDLERLGYRDVHLRIGDGYGGWPEAAPFDAIIVTAAAPRLPEPLVEQLKPGGRMVIPLGRYGQELTLVTKEEGKTRMEVLLPVAFVPMTGEIENKPDR